MSRAILTETDKGLPCLVVEFDDMGRVKEVLTAMNNLLDGHSSYEHNETYPGESIAVLEYMRGAMANPGEEF